MDTIRGPFPEQDGPESEWDAGDTAAGAMPSAEIGRDERRMQVRAYNFWASLLGSRSFPPIDALDPASRDDFGPNSVLLDFTGDIAAPQVSWLGGRLAQECDIDGEIRTLADVPPRSLLTRITDHYLQILANQAPIGFEAEFVNQRGATVLYRGILLPFSRDDVTIDHIFGVMSWKVMDARPGIEARVQESDEPAATRPALMRKPLGLTAWADGPADLEAGLSSQPPGSFAQGFGGDADFGAGLADVPSANPDPADMALADWLASARDLAHAAIGSEERSHRALYAAIGRAYDFALAAAREPEDFAEIIEDAGLKIQARSPLTPLVKLVFGTGYDKTRIAEFTLAIAYGQRLALPCGGLSEHLAALPGGLKALVQEERRLRREDAGRAHDNEAPAYKLRRTLRTLEARPLDSVRSQSSEFSIVVTRRLESGEIVVLGEVGDDEALLRRAARHLMT